MDLHKIKIYLQQQKNVKTQANNGIYGWPECVWKMKNKKSATGS